MKSFELPYIRPDFADLEKRMKLFFEEFIAAWLDSVDDGKLS